jgi:hypothetical protein
MRVTFAAHPKRQGDAVDSEQGRRRPRGLGDHRKVDLQKFLDGGTHYFDGGRASARPANDEQEQVSRRLRHRLRAPKLVVLVEQSLPSEGVGLVAKAAEQ